MLDIDNDGYLDFVMTDAAGNLYRLNFSKLDTLNDAYTQPLESSDWYLSHIAKSTGPAVRFLNKPTIGAIQNRFFDDWLGDGELTQQNYPCLTQVSRIDFMPSSTSPTERRRT